MNVLMIAPHAYKIKGGISTVLKNYYQSFLNIDNNLIPIYTVIDGGKLIKISVFICAYVKTIYTLILKNVDIVHIHTASGTSFYRKSAFVILGKLFNKKLIIHVHGGGFNKFYWDKSNIIQKRYISYILNKANNVIVLGENWKCKLSKYCNSEIVVINNSIGVPKENMYDSTNNNVLYLGRLEEGKGIYDLINAANDIISEYKDIRFILAGDGDMENVRRLIRKNKLESNFELTGWISSEDVKKLLRKTSIFVLPSYNEALPMSILEAMSYGIPIVSTKVGSIPEVIRENRNGILVEPGSVDSLKSSIIELIQNEEKRILYSKNNFNDASRKFSNKLNYKKLQDIYKEIVNK